MSVTAPHGLSKPPGWVADGSLGRSIWRRHAWADTAGRAFLGKGLSSAFAAMHARHTQFVARALGLAEPSDSAEPARLPVVLGRRVTAARSVWRSAADRTPISPPRDPPELATLDERPDEHAPEASVDTSVAIEDVATPTSAAPGQAETPLPVRTQASGGAVGVVGPTASGRRPLIARAESLAEAHEAPHAITPSPLHVNVISSSPLQSDTEGAPSATDVHLPQVGPVDLPRRSDADLAPSLDAEPQLRPLGAVMARRSAADAVSNASAGPLRRAAAHRVARHVDADIATKVDATSLPRSGSSDLARHHEADPSPATAGLRADVPFALRSEHAVRDSPATAVHAQPAPALSDEPAAPGLTVARAPVTRTATGASASAAASPIRDEPPSSAVARSTELEAHSDAERKIIGSFDATPSTPGGTSHSASLPVARAPSIAAPLAVDVPSLAEPARFAVLHGESHASPVARRSPTPVESSRAQATSESIAQLLDIATAGRPLLAPPAMPASPLSSSALLTPPMSQPRSSASPHAMKSASGGEPILAATANAIAQVSSTDGALTMAALRRSATPNLAVQASSVTVSASPRSLSTGSPLMGAVMQPGPGIEPVGAADVQADAGTTSDALDARLQSTMRAPRAATVLSRAIGSSATLPVAPRADAFPLVVANRSAGSTNPSSAAGIDRVLSHSSAPSGSSAAASPAIGFAPAELDLAASTLSLQRLIDGLPAPTERFTSGPIAEPQPASAQGAGAAASTRSGVTVDLDELVERALQALMLRLDIERERRGFNRWA